jgi:hypothetical protein
LSINSKAQDILKLKSGKEIRISIVEEGNEIIRYREYEDPAGPVYSITRDKVESVKYKKGTRQSPESEASKPEIATARVNDPLIQTNGSPQLTSKKRYVYLDGKVQSPRSVKTIMAEYPDAVSMYEKGRKMCNSSNSCAFGVIITSLVVSAIANGKEDQTEGNKIRYAGLAIDGGFIITAIILSSKGKQNIKKSVTIYNSTINKPVSYNLNMGLQENGVGIGMRF